MIDYPVSSDPVIAQAQALLIDDANRHVPNEQEASDLAALTTAILMSTWPRPQIGSDLTKIVTSCMRTAYDIGRRHPVDTLAQDGAAILRGLKGDRA